jgi:hypothetical protein
MPKCSKFCLIRVVFKVTQCHVLFFTPYPLSQLQSLLFAKRKNSLNQDWDSIPQYLMLKIQNNYGNSIHSNSKGTQEKIKMMNLRYTKFCDNLNFIPHLNATCFSLFFFLISLLRDQTQNFDIVFLSLHKFLFCPQEFFASIPNLMLAFVF